MSTAQALTSALFQFVWQGAVIALALWFVLLVLQKSSAPVRYAVCCAALLIMVALPAVTFYRLSLPNSRPMTAASIVLPSESLSSGTSAVPPAASQWMGRVQPLALPFWLLGMLLCSIRLLWTGRAIQHIRRGAETAGDALLAAAARLTERIRTSRHVQILVSPAIDSPSVVGWVRPVILLPAASLAGLEPEQLEAILAHEIAHIRRYDDIVNMMQTVVEIVLFYHPAVWWVSSRIRRERELCCDDVAVRVTGDCVGYARALARLERMRLAPSLALGAADDSLSYRIRRIVGETVPSRPQTWTPAVAILCLCIGLVLVTAGAQPVHSEPAHTPVAAASTAGPVAMVVGPKLRVMSSTAQSPVFGGDTPGVTVDLGAVTVQHRTAITYPESAWSNGIQGTVTVEVTTDRDGNVTDAHVLSGPIELRRASLQSVLQWRFGSDSANTIRQIAIRFDAAAAQAEQTKSADEFGGRRFHRIVPSDEAADGTVEAPYSQTLSAMAKSLADQMGTLADMKQHLIDEQTQAAMEQAQEALREALANSQTQNPFFNDETRQNIEEALQQARANLKEAQTEGILQDMPMKLQALRQQLRFLAIGGTLTKIEFDGVPENTKAEVLGQFPVKIGETLTAESLEKITSMLDWYDLKMNIQSSDKNVVIHLSH